MDYTLAFEISSISKFHYYGGSGVFCGLFLVAFWVFLSSFGTASHTNIWILIVSALFSIVFLYFSIQLTINTTQMIHHIYNSYENDDVKVVEGVVEKCDTAFFYKSGRGSFEIEGIAFDYGRTTGIPGYRGKENLIHTDGQKVRIHYVPYSNQNIIVKIELPIADS